MTQALQIAGMPGKKKEIQLTAEQMPGEAYNEYLWALSYWDRGGAVLPSVWIGQQEIDPSVKESLTLASQQHQWLERLRLYRRFQHEANAAEMETMAVETARQMMTTMKVLGERVSQSQGMEPVVDEASGRVIDSYDLRVETMSKAAQVLASLAKSASGGTKINVDARTAVVNNIPSSSDAGRAWGAPPAPAASVNALPTLDATSAIDGEEVDDGDGDGDGDDDDGGDMSEVDLDD